jgi:hypothetical protein
MAESGEPKKKNPRTPMTRSRWLWVGSLAILVLVVVTFIGAPILTSMTGGNRPVFGRYGNQEILYQPGNFFGRQYEAIAQSLRERGNQENLELQLRLAWREAFNRAVLHAAILRHAEQSGLEISEQRVDELLASDPRFQVNGRFDAQAYERIGNQERFQLRRFHREVAIFERFIRDVLTGARSSEAEGTFVAEMSGPQRSFEVIRFPFDEFPQSQVRQFAEDNPELFTTLNLAVVTLGTQDESEEIRALALEPGTPIGDLARTYSRDLYADQDGQIGEVYGYELQQELTDPDDLSRLLELEEGEISRPMETTAGWAFYEALSEPAAFDPEADGALADVRTYMQNFEQGRIQDYVRDEAASFVSAAQQDGFATVADRQERSIVETPFFPINYGNLQLFPRLQSSDIPELSDAAFRQDFFEAAFALDPDEISAPLVLRRSVLVLRLLEGREAPEDQVEALRDRYPSIHRRFSSDLIESTFVNEELLEDNFSQTFNRFVVGAGR